MLDCGDNEYSDTSFVIGSQHDREVNPVGHWPWMASIGYYNEKDEWVHQCGATLISSQHFLTAAHCMADYTTLKIHVGDFNFTLQKSQLYGEDLEIEDVQTHPNFAGKYSYNDVAVIRTNPVKFSYFVRPICLPKAAGTNRDYFRVELLGWGSSSLHGKASKTLKRVSLTLYPNKYCNNTHIRQDKSKEKIQQVVPDLFPSHVACSGVETGMQGACAGDSGGPLQFFNAEANRYYQVAIVHGSAGDCGSSTLPSVFVRLDDQQILDFVWKATDEKVVLPPAIHDSFETLGEVQEGDEQDESAWLLISNLNEVDLDMELYNWKTGKQCHVNAKMPSELPNTHVAVFNDTAVVCSFLAKSCFKLIFKSKEWIKTSEAPLIISTAVLNNVRVPGMGMMLLGWEYSSVKRSAMFLDDPDSEWKIGPSIGSFSDLSGACVVQLNDTATVFLGVAKQISVYDWTSNKLTKQSATLHSRHIDGSCAVVMDDNLNSYAVITGDKFSYGNELEIWNPADGSLQLEPIPFERDNQAVFHSIGLTTVNKKRDLLLFGVIWTGKEKRNSGSINWRFNFVSKTWTTEGNFLKEREKVSAVQIGGLNCS